MNRAVLLLLAVCLSACVSSEVGGGGEMRREAHSVDLGKADRLDAVIEFPAGEFTLLGGATKLVEGEYRFNHEGLKPVVEYRESAGVGRLELHAEKKPAFGNVRAVWEVRLNDALPLDLELKMGAGKADVNLGTVALRQARVHFGAGQMTLDLRGKPKRGYTVEVHGGVGHGRIYIPGGVGVHADVTGGIGEISTQGELRKEGHHYYNGLWDKSAEKVELKVRGGVGKIELIAAE